MQDRNSPEYRATDSEKSLLTHIYTDTWAGSSDKGAPVRLDLAVFGLPLAGAVGKGDGREISEQVGRLLLDDICDLAEDHPDLHLGPGLGPCLDHPPSGATRRMAEVRTFFS